MRLVRLLRLRRCFTVGTPIPNGLKRRSTGIDAALFQASVALQSATAAYMHCVGYKNIDAAIEEIRQVRPITNPSKILLKSVKEIL